MFFIIYFSIFKTYSFLLKRKHSEILDVWYRNSFKLGYWSFGRSDIDITVLINKSHPDIIQNITRTHNLIRKYLPIIGEINFFSEELKGPLIHSINSLELKRDPVLMSKFSVNKNVDFIDQILFLHRFILANWPKLEKNQVRKEKIQYVLEATSISDHLDLIGELASLLKVEQSGFKKEYLFYLENGDKHTKIIPTLSSIYCLFFNKTCYLNFPDPLTEFEKTMIEKTILWELWGCYSNQNSDNEAQLTLHFQNIFGKAIHIFPAKKVDELKSLASLMKLPDGE